MDNSNDTDTNSLETTPSSSEGSYHTDSNPNTNKRNPCKKNQTLQINIILIVFMTIVTIMLSVIYPHGIKSFLENSGMITFFSVTMITLITPFLMAVLIERFTKISKSFRSILYRTILIWISVLTIGGVIQLIFNSVPKSLSNVIAICVVSVLLGGLFTVEEYNDSDN